MSFIGADILYHVFPTFPLGDVIDEQVIWSSSKINPLGHQSLLYGIVPVEDDQRFGSEEEAEDVSILLPQLPQNKTTCVSE